jgi:hypothetical protein
MTNNGHDFSQEMIVRLATEQASKQASTFAQFSDEIGLQNIEGVSINADEENGVYSKREKPVLE